MTEPVDLFKALAAPFPPEAISWRVGPTNKKAWERDKSKPKRGQALAYIDARDVGDRFDEVLGPANWSNRYVPMPNGSTCCEISIRVNGEWIGPKSNGAGATDMEGDKGQYSDAFKRAAVLWGVGRYLYDVKTPWIGLDDYWGLPDSELPALRRLLTGQKEPSSRSSRDEYARIETALRNCKNIKALATCWTINQEAIGKLAQGHRQSLAEEKDRCKIALQDMEVAA